MATAMRRGANVALTREIPDLTGVVLGVGWDAGAETALSDDLVMATILCDARGHALSSEHFVFFNQLSSPELSVQQLDAALGPDQEQVTIELGAVPPDVARIVVVLYLNDGPGLRRTLGRLKRCELRVLDLTDNRELLRSEDLAPALTTETGLTLGEIYRHNGDWKFKVLGQGYTDGISGIATDFAVPL
jgi:tellurium resistance protein TerD